MDDPLREANKNRQISHKEVLIPLLVDDPLRVFWFEIVCKEIQRVLIPLLVDDPLRVLFKMV